MTDYHYNPKRFWAKVDQRGPKDCWEWTASLSQEGYGHFTVRDNGKHRPAGAHRVAYQEANGAIPDGMHIDHICHNTVCVNPAHLRLATPKQNMEHRKGARSDSRSGIRGVMWDADRNSWKAHVKHAGKGFYVGNFPSLAEAVTAVTAKRNELFTHNDADRTIGATK